MCGHCTERAALAERVLSLETRALPAPDPLLSTVHLQELRDWRQPAWLENAQEDPTAVIVVMCRAWTDRVAGIPGAPLRDVLPSALHTRLDAWRRTLDLPSTWAWLGDDAATTPDPLPLQGARDELDGYLAGWLHLRDGASPPWNEVMLHERLPRVSVALDIVARESPDDARITALAMSSPGAGSPFSAIDLWLQRRALQALVAHHGIGFAIRLLGHLRSGAVLALVLRGDLDHQELIALQGALQDRPDNGTEGTSDLRTALAVLLSETAGIARRAYSDR
jgi:hypothetical protein